MPRFTTPFTFVFVSCLIVGCSPSIPLGQVEGTLRMRGGPVSDVVIIFIPREDGDGASIRSFGQPDATGRFVLRTERGDAGAVVGSHVAILEDLAPYKAPRTEDGTLLERPAQRFPPHYSDPIRSPWIVTVRDGQQTIDLTVE